METRGGTDAEASSDCGGRTRLHSSSTATNAPPVYGTATAAASPEDGCLAVKGDAAALLREQLGVGGGQVLPCGNNMDNRGATGIAGEMALATSGRSIAVPATAWTTAGSSRASSQEGARAAQPQPTPVLTVAQYGVHVVQPQRGQLKGPLVARAQHCGWAGVGQQGKGRARCRSAVLLSNKT